MLRVVLIAVVVVESLGSSSNPHGHSHTAHHRWELHKPYNLELESYNETLSAFEHHCEATIINQKVALTAASCTHGKTPSMLRFRHLNAIAGIGGTLHYAERIMPHENYQPGSLDYNIAIVSVTEPFPSSSAILVANHEPLAGMEAISIGWGLLPHTNTRPPKVRHAQFSIFDHHACEWLRNPEKPITERILCAGHLEDTNLDCGGDIGGPLVAYNHLVGIVISSVCGSNSDTMGLFTDVGHLHKWIEKAVNYEQVIDSPM